MASNTLNVVLLELRDTEANLTTNFDASTDAKTLSAGRLAFVTDSGKETRFKIGDGSTAFANLPWNYATVPFATCSTAQTTAAKSVTGVKGFTLTTDQVILVKFTNGSKVASATLSVNGSAAKNIVYSGSNVTASHIFTANRVYLLRYNGTQFEVCGDLDTDSNTTYTNASLGQGYGICETEAATSAKTVALSGYSLVAGGVVSVKFKYAVNVANVTLNINSKGAKSLYYHGAATTAKEIIPAGAIATFMYDGTQYHLIALDDMRHELTVTGNKTISLKDGYGNSLGSGTITYAGIGALKQDASISLTGDVTGSGSFSNGAVSITTTVGDNSHNHVSANISDREKVDNNDTSKLPTLNKVNSLISTATADLNSTIKLKGTIGSSGATYTSIPSSTDTGVTLKEGYAYRIITTGIPLTADKSKDGNAYNLDVGDLVVYSDTTDKWILIPSGDDVTKISAGAGITTAGDDSSSAGSDIIGTGTISLRKSGVTAGTYGNNTAGTLKNSSKFKVPKVTVDKYGRITSASEIELTTDNDKVKQNNSSANADYRVLLSASANDTAETGETNKSGNLKFNPSTGKLNLTGDFSVTKSISAGTTISATGNISSNANISAGGNISATGTVTGTRFIGQLNTNKLDQESTDYLILDGNYVPL